MTIRCAGFYVFTLRARVRPKLGLYWRFSKSGGGVKNPEICLDRGGPIQFGAPRVAAFDELLVLELLQRHRSERSSVTHATLR
jgi:hypothetical protein